MLRSNTRSLGSLVCLLMGAVCIAMYPGTADGEIIRVPVDYPTIQQAVDSATTRDTVLIGPGAYVEDVSIAGKDLALIGELGAEFTTVTPAGGSAIQIGNCGFLMDGLTVTGGGAVHTVYVAYSSGIIRNCVFHDNIPTGTANREVVSLNGSTVTVTRCLFYNNGGIGCVGLRSGSENSAIINNTFDSNERGFFSIAGGGKALNNTVTNSWERGIGAVYAEDWRVLDYNNLWNNNPNYDIAGIEGTNDIHLDPQYVSPGESNYHLQPGSPCIDAGHPDPIYQDPDGSRADIGAFPNMEIAYPIPANLSAGPMNSYNQVTDSLPQISWVYEDSASTSQQQYEIEVGLDADWSVAELWDSGPVASSGSLVTYTGAPLTNNRLVFLRVRLNNGSTWGSWRVVSFHVHARFVIHVPQDAPSIQSAVDLAIPGDTVLVDSGPYVENISVIDKSIVIRSTSGAEVTQLSPEHPGSPCLIVQGWPDTVTFKFSGFTVTGGGSNNTVHLGVTSSIIDSCVFHHNIPFGSQDVGVISCEYTSLVVRRCLFYNNGGIGCVGLREGSENSLIINNTFDSNERGFFSIANGGTALNNIITNSFERGIGALSTSNWTLVDYNNLWNNNPDYDVAGTGGPHDIHVDPQYVDPFGWNYGLLEGSPCIDAGHPDPAYNDPDGSRNDMGALPLAGLLYPIPQALSVNPVDADGYVTDSLPQISWVYDDTAATTQNQYQIQVGMDLNWTVAETWDSGPVLSPAPDVIYGGPPLANTLIYYLRVRVHNGTNWGDWRTTSFEVRNRRVIHVPGDVPTIQDGVNVALQGDTVLVAPGTYLENVSIIGKSIVLRGSDGAMVTQLSPASLLGPCVVMRSDNDSTVINFSGFTISGGGRTETVFLKRVAVTIDSCILHDNIPVGSPNVEVISCNAAPTTVRRCIFYNNGGIGCVGLREGSENSLIINNTFDSNERGFFSIAGGGTALNNIITNSLERGIGAGSVADWTLVDYNNLWNNHPDYDVAGTGGPHDMHIDPRYVAPGEHNYLLNATSPCIDAGHPDPAYNDPDGSRSDMGAIPSGGLPQSDEYVRFSPAVFEGCDTDTFSQPVVLELTQPIRGGTIPFKMPPGTIFHGISNSGLSTENWEVLLYEPFPGSNEHAVGFFSMAGDSLPAGTTTIFNILLSAESACLTSRYLHWDTAFSADPQHRLLLSDINNLDLMARFNPLADSTEIVGFAPGDVNRSGETELSDLTCLIGELFRNEACFCVEAAADANGTGTYNIADITWLVSFLFRGGSASVCPSPDAPVAPKRSDLTRLKSRVENGHTILRLETEIELRGLQITLNGAQQPQPVNLLNGDIELFDGSNTIGLFDREGTATLPVGSYDILLLGDDYELVEVIASDMQHQALRVTTDGTEILPTEYELAQNYPNPFNPSTQITFSLPRMSNVRLTVFNVLGQEITPLVNGPLDAGVHTVTWEATDSRGRRVSSGLYLYRLETDDFVATKKMLLLK